MRIGNSVLPLVPIRNRNSTVLPRPYNSGRKCCFRRKPIDVVSRATIAQKPQQRLAVSANQRNRNPAWCPSRQTAKAGDNGGVPLQIEDSVAASRLFVITNVLKPSVCTDGYLLSPLRGFWFFIVFSSLFAVPASRLVHEKGMRTLDNHQRNNCENIPSISVVSNRQLSGVRVSQVVRERRPREVHDNWQWNSSQSSSVGSTKEQDPND